MIVAKNKIWIFVAIAVWGICIYANSLNASWHFDDLSFITQNEKIRDITNVKAVWSSLDHPVRFITFMTFALNYHFHKYDIFGYHVVNIFIHLGATLCLFWMVRLLFRTPALRRKSLAKKSVPIAILSAFLFLTHPIQTQAVTYITQRFASLATFFYLLSVCLYLSARLRKNKKVMWFVAASVTALLGMMSKQIVMTLPFNILLIEWCLFGDVKQPLGQALREFFKRYKKLIGVGLLFFLIVPLFYSFDVKGMLSMKANAGSWRGDPINSWIYFLTQFAVVLTYIKLLLFPIGQNLLYDFRSITHIGNPTFIFSALTLIGILVAAYRYRKKNVLVFLGVGWFFIALLVESSVIPIRHVIFEHRCYLPSVGFVLALSSFLGSQIKDPKRFIIIAIMLIATLSYLTVQRNRVWKNDITLWTDVIKKAPNKTRAYMNVGLAYSQQSDYDQAIAYFNKGIEVNPRSTFSYNNRGIVYNKLEDYDRALQNFDQSISINQTHAEVFSNRGDTHRFKKNFPKALEDYNKALELDPESDQVLGNRGIVYSNLEQDNKALEDYSHALKLNPYSVEHYINRGNLLGRMRRYDFALKDFETALLINPKKAELYNNRGNVYRRLKLFKEAIVDYSRAIELDSNYSQAYSNRGIIYKTQNDFEKALIDYEKAVELEPDNATALTNRANLYHAKSDFKHALEDYNKAIAIDPDFSDAIYNRALNFLALKQYPLAMKDLESVINLDRGNVNAYLQLSRIYLLQKEYQQALAAAQRAIQVNPTEGVVYYQRALVLASMGESSKALRDVGEAQALGFEVQPGFIKHLQSSTKQ